MASGAGTRYDPHLIQLFINTMGLYPPGTILDVEVDLSTGTERFIMVSASLCREPALFNTPLCTVLKLPDGSICPPPHNVRIVDLGKKGRVLAVLNDY
jgi:hypothetical protein